MTGFAAFFLLLAENVESADDVALSVDGRNSRREDIGPVNCTWKGMVSDSANICTEGTRSYGEDRLARVRAYYESQSEPT